MSSSSSSTSSSFSNPFLPLLKEALFPNVFSPFFTTSEQPESQDRVDLQDSFGGLFSALIRTAFNTNTTVFKNYAPGFTNLSSREFSKPNFSEMGFPALSFSGDHDHDDHDDDDHGHDHSSHGHEDHDDDGHGHDHHGHDHVTPKGAAAFKTVAVNGDRIDNNDNNNIEKLKWRRTNTRADGTVATVVNFAFGDKFEIPGISLNDAKDLFKKALQTWANYAPLDFEEVKYQGNDSEIDILAQSKNIDGKSKILAEAFFPTVGDVTYDLSENWTKLKFLEVSVHELGHSLGLDHEGGDPAIMNASLKNRFKDPDKPFLLEDDILGIQNLYGKGKGLPVKSLAESSPPSTTNNNSENTGGNNPTANTTNESSQLGPNLVTNGSFENIPLKTGETGLYKSIKGWTTRSGKGFRVDKRTKSFGKAADGQAWAELDILKSNAIIAQNVDTLTGQTYVLSVDYSKGTRNQSTAGIDVYWEGKKLGGLRGGRKGRWRTFEYEVKGSARNASTLAFVAKGNANSKGGLIDNITVKAKPRATSLFEANSLLEEDIYLGATEKRPEATGLPSALSSPDLGTVISTTDLMAAPMPSDSTFI